MLKNVENWQFKNKAEIEALSDEELIKLDEELTKAMKVFYTAQVELSDEMTWQFMVVPGVMASRNLKHVVQT